MKICPSISELSDFSEKRICPEAGCGKEFVKSSNLQLHLVKHHKIGKLGDSLLTADAQFHCPVVDCVYNLENGTGKHFSQRRLLKQHYGKVHAPRNWSCVKCGWCSAIPSMVRRHTVNCKRTVTYPVIFQNAADSSKIKASLSGNQINIDLVDKLSDRETNMIDYIMQEHNYVSKFVSVISTSGDISFVKTGDCYNFKYAIDNDQDNNTKIEPLKQSDRFTQTLAKTMVKSDTSVKSNVETQTIEYYVSNCYGEDRNTTSSLNFSNSNFPSSDMSQDIQTQTALDELLYSNIKQTDYPDNDIFSDFTLLSDIQTQTSWPYLDVYNNAKDLKRDSLLISTETQTCNEIFDCDNSLDNNYGFEKSKELLTLPDEGTSTCYKETQTCDCILSLEHLHKDMSMSVNNSSSLHCNMDEQIFKQSCSLNSIETQTQFSNFIAVNSKFLSRKCDVMLSCSSIETQTCDNLFLDDMLTQ